MRTNKSAARGGWIACVLIILAAFGSGTPAQAESRQGSKRVGRYGPEFTFAMTGDGVTFQDRDVVYVRAQQHLISNQHSGAKFSLPEKHRLLSPNGWWFHLSVNPGVIEVQMSPLTVEETRIFKDDIQDAIFVTMANAGFFPWDFLGGGHLNISTEIFGDDLLLARNFLADYWSHNELFMGMLGYDTRNAYPVHMYAEREQIWIQSILDRVDKNYYSHDRVGITQFFRDVDVVLSQGKPPGSWFPNLIQGKNHDISMEIAGRIELRSVRPQKNMDVWLSQIELFEGRINYLRRFKYPLSMKPRVPINASLRYDKHDASSDSFTPPVDPSRALHSFHEYLTQSGQSWWNHKSAIWPAWQDGPEVRRFEQSPGFRRRERRLRERGPAELRDLAGCEDDLIAGDE